jgi:carboxylesterase type B
MDHDVLLVTINFRVGPLGFMSMGDDVMPGNLALWDQGRESTLFDELYLKCFIT